MSTAKQLQQLLKQFMEERDLLTLKIEIVGDNCKISGETAEGKHLEASGPFNMIFGLLPWFLAKHKSVNFW